MAFKHIKVTGKPELTEFRPKHTGPEWITPPQPKLRVTLPPLEMEGTADAQAELRALFAILGIEL